MELPTDSQTSQIVDHFFRHEYGKVLSFLTRKFGANHFEIVEDAVQESLFKAMQLWPFAGVPANPSGWIAKASQNKLIDDLRRHNRFDQKSREILESAEKLQLPDEVLLQNELKDDLLKMMFACCKPEINEEYQIILALKILCGFGNKEIAAAMFKSEDAVAKAYQRGKEKIKETGFLASVPAGDELTERLNNLLQIIYLLFNEGYKASQGSHLIRKDLCLEAIRLTGQIIEHPSLAVHQSYSLMALMLFQASRFESRIDPSGKLLTLKEQDRTLWDSAMIDRGVLCLEKASQENLLTEYYLQASIAAVHCFAPDFKSTDWSTILSLYNLLRSISTNKIVDLNRLVALARVEGSAKAINELNQLRDPRLENFYLFHAIEADLLCDLGKSEEARTAYKKAATLADNELEKQYLTALAELI